MTSLATQTIRYIETLTIGQGRLAGQPFTVLPWQRRFLHGALAPDVAEAALSLGRGGGEIDPDRRDRMRRASHLELK